MNTISRNKIADSAWEYIKPPINIKTPGESDGYNEWEVYKSFEAGAEFAIRELENISIEFAEWLVNHKEGFHPMYKDRKQYVSYWGSSYIGGRIDYTSKELFEIFLKERDSTNGE